MRILTQAGLALGLLLLLGLLVWQGFLEVLRLLAASGWRLLSLPLVWLPSLLVATIGWLRLFPPAAAPRFGHGLLAMWVGRAVNDLLPVATIGGEIVKARMLVVYGYTGLDAAASVLVDKAIQALAVALWGCVGVLALLFLLQVGSEPSQAGAGPSGDAFSSWGGLPKYAVIGFALLSVSAVAFMRMQRLGLLGALAKLGGRLIKTDGWAGLTVNARQVDARVRALYQRRGTVPRCLAYRALSLALQTLEVWLACYLLGRPIGPLEGVMLKSLTATLSDIAFVIPNAYGVQEGAFILVGAVIGLQPELCLALSLSLRIRDVLLDPAGLLYLHRLESKRYFRDA